MVCAHARVCVCVCACIYVYIAKVLKDKLIQSVAFEMKTALHEPHNTTL